MLYKCYINSCWHMVNSKFCFLEFMEFFFFNILIRVWLNPQMWNPQIQEGRFLLLFQFVNEATEYQKR